MNVELWIINGTTAYQPSVKSDITWETSRYGEPSSLKFNCLQDDKLNITEGNAVKLLVDGTNVFFGFIFSIQRDKSNELKITAYDQLRYLKNKDSYVYTNKRADQVISMIAGDFGLNVGSLINTDWTIAKKIEDNQTLFDIIQNALDETLRSTKKLYVFYDDFGKLTLKDSENMLTNILIDEDTAQNLSYTSSINDNTYNQIKLTYNNKDTGKREVYIAKDSGNINKWGVLQFYESIDNPQGAADKANSLLQLYNAKTKNLKIDKAFGDVRVRAGTSVIVKLNLGDVSLQNYMLVEKAKHTFSNNSHSMDLTLRGGEINSA